MADGPSVAPPDDAGSEPLEMSAVEIQQEYYEAMGDADWELYEKKDRKHLLQKIGIALCGPPTEEGNLINVDDDLKLQGYGPREEEVTQKVFKKICEQAKYSHNGEHIIISILRVVCVAPSEEVPMFKKEPKDYWVDLHTKKGKDVVTICVFHVFSVRKCISLKVGVKSCKVYVDHDARVYKDWNSFLTENNLPKGVLVVPENGEYKGELIENDIADFSDDGHAEMPKVKLTVSPSPALGLGAKVLSMTDKASMVASLGAGTLGIGIGVASALSIPVAAPVTLAVLGVGAVTSVYGLVRSSIHLADRKKHEQSIGLKNSEARQSWINILVSSVGLSFSAALRLATWAAATGANVRIILNALQFLEYSTIASGLLGLVNGFGDMIDKYKKYNEPPTRLELFQFASSVLFFGIGVMSNQTARDIVQDAQAKSINEIRDSLTSNSKRKMFDKVTAETRRLEGTMKGNADVIKGLRTIENKNDFFSKLAKMNKEVNKNKLRVSLSSDGAPLINNQHKVSVNQLYGLGKDGRQEVFAKYGPAKVTTKNVPTRLYTTYATTSKVDTVGKDLACYVRPEEIIKITTFVIKLSQVDKEYLYQILSEMSADLHDSFLLLCTELLASLLPAEARLVSFLPNCNIRIILFVLNFLRSKIKESDPDTDSALKIVMKDLIRNGRIKPETIMMLKESLLKWTCEQKKRNGDDPSKYDDLHTIFRKTCRKYKNLYAGQVIEAGENEILVKLTTIENLEDLLKDHPQEKCDLFIDVCFNIISMLSAAEVDNLNLFNPDEDVIMRVVDFMSKWCYRQGLTMNHLLDNFTAKGEIDLSLAVYIKSDMIEWYAMQTVRTHQICTLCNGIRFGEEC